MTRNDWVLAGCVAALAGAAAFFFFSEDADDSVRAKRSQVAKIDPKDPTGPDPAARTASVVDTLCRGGWPKPQAEEFDRLNVQCWPPKHGEWGTVADRVLPRVAGLGRLPAAMTLVRAHPHLAVLLAFAKDPSRTAALLNKFPPERVAAANHLFEQYALPDDIDLLVAALERHADVLFELAAKGVTGAEQLFMHPRDGTADDEYDRWLGGLARAHLLPGGGMTDVQKSVLGFLMIQGPRIREKMIADPAFGGQFRDVLWPRFLTVAPPAEWDTYAALPGLWEVLAHKSGNGAEWVRKYFELPMFLLVGDGAYPQEFHEVIEAALDKDDMELLVALQSCRGEEDFLHLLRRRPELEKETFRAVLIGLCELAAPVGDMADAPEAVAALTNTRRNKLRQIKGWDEIVLKKEFDPKDLPFLITLIPGVGVLTALDKAIDGRELTADDWISAGVDAATLISLGTAKAGQVVAKVAVGNAKGPAVNQLRNQAVKRMTAKSSSGVPRVARGATLGTAMTARAGTTSAVLKVVGSSTGVAQSSLKRLIDWEVRFVVTRGGKALVSIGLIDGKGIALSLAEILAHKTVAALRDAPRAEQDDERAYRQNAHAYWLTQLLTRHSDR